MDTPGHTSPADAGIKPLSPHIGAEMEGMDLSKNLDARTRGRLRTALSRYGVLVLRGQELVPEDIVSVAEIWGRAVHNPFLAALPGHPAVSVISKEPHQRKNIGNRWHTDGSYEANPAVATLLYAVEVPSLGGDTLFASQYTAFDTLSDGMKATLFQLSAVHGNSHVVGSVAHLANRETGEMNSRLRNPQLANQVAEHPVLIRHPTSGRTALYVNAMFTLRFSNWTEEESKPLLSFLHEHAVKLEFSCRVSWEPGTLVIWDNLSVLHRALNDYHNHRRIMYRVVAAGDELHPGQS